MDGAGEDAAGVDCAPAGEVLYGGLPWGGDWSAITSEEKLTAYGEEASEIESEGRGANVTSISTTPIFSGAAKPVTCCWMDALVPLADIPPDVAGYSQRQRSTYPVPSLRTMNCRTRRGSSLTAMPWIHSLLASDSVLERKK